MLRFVRIKDRDANAFNWIPKYLFEQIKHREYDVEQIYKYGPIFVCSRMNCFYLMVNDENKIKGVLWISVDPVVEMICVNVLSVDREYQNNGVIKQTIDYLRNLKENDPDFKVMLEQLGIDLKEKIMWPTKRPRAFEKVGAKISNRVIMEI